MWVIVRVKTCYIKKPWHLVIAGHNVEETIKKYSPHNLHIVKSLSSIRSIVVEFESSKDKFPTNSREPVLFQELIKGKNIRVHVIDGVAITIKIKSSTVDYRYAAENNVIAETVVLPKYIENECISISQQLNLRFCGIDLIERNNEYYLSV